MHLNAENILKSARRYVAERISPAILEPVAELTTTWWTPEPREGFPPPSQGEGLAASYAPVAPGTSWGAPWSTTWFHVTGDVPAEHRGRKLEVDIDLGFNVARAGFQAEGLALDAAGRSIKGIHPRNHWIPVAGDEVDIFVEATAIPNLMFREHPYSPIPLGDPETSGTEHLYTFKGARLVFRNPEVVALATELTSLRELAEELPPKSARRWEIITALGDALVQIDLADIAGTAAAARACLAPALARTASPSALQLTAIGHAHLDTAWLWPLRETRRKAVRTIANAVAIADFDDDALFTLSVAQHAAWVQEDDPELFERMLAHVRSGKIVPVGGMWIEPDANLPGGEALVRQLTTGMRFFRDEMGHTCRELWLPDSFGYSAVLPQLARLAGMRWFLTQKLSWNTENEFPHHTLWWEGLDGSKIFTHFPSADTYCSELTGAELAHAERNFKDKGRASMALLPYGYGDGGGGPTREMLETWRTVADLEGSPRLVRQSPIEFFTAAEAEYAEAPVWTGELYLEKHRGAATSQAGIKAGNRRNEALLQAAELWATTAHVRVGAPYPHEELAECWRIVLVNQFHDILPGTSIAWVNKEAVEQHRDVTQRLEALIEQALTALGTTPGTGLLADASPLGTLGVLPAEGTHAEPVSVEAHCLDNGHLRVLIDDGGLVTSIVDLAAGRELLPEGERAGLLQLHHDFPAEWDAWDIDASAHRNPTDLTEAISITTSDDDGVGVVEVSRAFGNSSAVQRFELAPGSRELKVGVEVDWHEEDKLLKLAFPLDLHCHDAAYEVQFGHLRRPTHHNTPWDAARFEVAAHRWLHLEEASYGVAVANSRTYGWDVTRTTRAAGPTWSKVRATLVKGARYPDPRADAGQHSFEFVIAPGVDLLGARSVGYRLAQPTRTRAGEPVAPLVSVEGTAVVETVKLADDGSGDVVLRVFEPLGSRTRARLTLDFDVIDVSETDLLEEDNLDPDIARALRSHNGGEVELDLRPFQVVTIRARVAGA